MQEALEALEILDTVMQRSQRTESAITALKQALAEPELEPFVLQADAIAMRRPELRESHQITLTAGTAIYTAPTPRKPLTDEEIIEHFEAEVDTGLLSSFADGVRFAERAHGIGEQHE